MKGILVHTTLDRSEILRKIVERGMIGADSEPLCSQIPLFKDRPLIFGSYLCEGYRKTYVDRRGIIFETDSPIVYACPIDSFGLMRGGNWLSGYERFIFPSIEEMLNKYPTNTDFKKDFQEYFRNLKPREKEIYPNNTLDFAELRHRMDFCLRPEWNTGCNEITFSKSLKIRNGRVFESREELERFLEE